MSAGPLFLHSGGPLFSWIVPTPEYWHGFTFGIRTTERIEPTAPPSTDPAPEPGTIALVGTGLIGLVRVARRRMKK